MQYEGIYQKPRSALGEAEILLYANGILIGGYSRYGEYRFEGDEYHVPPL